MSYFDAFVVVAFTAVAAAVASWLVGRSLTVEARRRHHDVGNPVFLQVGVMLAVLLAFVFSEVWGEYRSAALAINGECGALHGAAMIANALPDNDGQPVTRAIAGYAVTVVNTEWPMMTHRRRSPRAAQAFDAIIRQAVNLKVTQSSESATQNQIISLLSQAHANRETRTFQLTQAMPPLMWFMLIAISAILVGFVVFSGADYPTHMIFSAVFAGSVALVLVLVRMLDFPFEGALALPDTDFVKTLGEVTILARGAT